MYPLKSDAVTDFDEVEDLLAAFDGDAVAALRSVIADCHHLRVQLALTEGAKSRGFTRGWLPSVNRPGEAPRD